MGLLQELKQTQKLSPQMIQFMEILQMETMELQAYISDILLENPTLETESGQKAEEAQAISRRTEWLEANDWQNRWYHQEDARDLSEQRTTASTESLYDHLWEQLNTKTFSSQQKTALRCVLTGLNDKGYLEETTEELAARCGQDAAIVLWAEDELRKLEPAGVGARTLSQCLALQLERMGQTGLPLRLVREHLEDIAHSHYNRIAKHTGASRQEIQEACDCIRRLEPHPGSSYSPEKTTGYILPELQVTKTETGLTVTGADFLPELKVSGYYQKMLAQTDEEEVRRYLDEKVRQANWVIRSIDQRRSTLLRCGQIIAARQEAFFRCGPAQLVPLTMADVAKETGIHESTVSRTIKGKYLQCAQGVFPLSYFFARALPHQSEGSVCSSVKEELRRIIESEDKRKPLSDQKICDLLARQDMVLSRRTVAKYREELGIAPATGRKTF